MIHRRIAGAHGWIPSWVLRARRGWAPRDVWSLDQHLCHVTGGMLRHLAKTTHAWPESAEFTTFADWQEAVMLRANALGDYRSDDDTTHVPAQEALHWVADHLTHLWD